jgi:hypothetical protein
MKLYYIVYTPDDNWDNLDQFIAAESSEQATMLWRAALGSNEEDKDQFGNMVYEPTNIWQVPEIPEEAKAISWHDVILAG